jgi:hypothetical protein
MEPVIHSQHSNRKKNSAKVNLTISIVLHALVFAAGAYWAAHEGYLGKKIQELSLMLVPKEVKEEPKKEEAKTEEVKKVEPVKPAEIRRAIEETVAKAPPPPTPADLGNAAAPPPPTELPAFVFDTAGDSKNDPVNIYCGQIEKAIRMKWQRPSDIDDLSYAAEIEVSLNATGKITAFDWKKGSGNKKWDDSVKLAMSQTTSLDAAPPKDFPNKFVVRFDVQPVAEQLMSRAD